MGQNQKPLIQIVLKHSLQVLIFTPVAINSHLEEDFTRTNQKE